MAEQALKLPSKHQLIVDRFIAACRADGRILAGFLGGSYATGKADAHSDVDLYLITADDSYREFLASKEAFICQLGEPLFLEDWGVPHIYFFIFADGTEGELGIGRASRFQHIHGGAYKVLVDKRGILADAVFPEHTADPAEQHATLRQLIMSFWHEVGHFTKALAREQLWFAYGSLETMRHICVNLARMRHNFADAGVGNEPFFKVEEALPVEELAPLFSTFCPLERNVLLRAGRTVLDFYKATAAPLAQQHSIPYPAKLEQLMVAQLDNLGEWPPPLSK